MRIKSIKTTFDPRKLEKELKERLVDLAMESYTEIVEVETKKGLRTGKDIYGKSFKAIQPVTQEIRNLSGHRGTKPLIESGDMKDSIETIKRKKNHYALEATSYGNSANKNVHQTGFRLDGGLKQEQPYIKNKHYNFSKVGKIPARPWFPTQDSVEGSKNINKKFEKIAKQYFKSFNKAFTKRGIVG